MTLWLAIGLIVAGVFIGVISGMVGIGGGLLVVPLLMLVFGFTQQKANGTSLAMLLPPIGIFAVLAYSKAGNIDWRYAGLLAAGFAGGAWVGGVMVNRGWIHPTILRLALAALLLYVASNMLFRTSGRARAALETCIMLASFGGAYVAMRLLGRHWERRPSPTDIYHDRLRRPPAMDYEI